MKFLIKCYDLLLHAIYLATKKNVDNPIVLGLNNSHVKIDKKERGLPVVTIQVVEDAFYYGIFCSFYKEVSKFKNFNGKLLMPNVAKNCDGLFGYFSGKSWVKAYSSIIREVAYKPTIFRNPIHFLQDYFLAYLDWIRIGKDKNYQIVLGNINVTDLVNDTYLRYKPSPKFIPDDKFTLQLIFRAREDYRKSERYFKKNKSTIFLTSYSAYIHHGVPVRVALNYGVNVWAFGNFQAFAKRLSLEDWNHTKNTSEYYSDFNKLSQKQAKLGEAEMLLKSRFSGHIDSSISYMKKSAYISEVDQELPDLSNAVVVFLHDFFDSPHVYEGMLFNDFWSWIIFTIESLKDWGGNFYLRAHPNQFPENKEVLKNLSELYPDLIFLSEGIGVNKLVEANLMTGVTAYGTVAHELAYFGIPTIAACLKHPHHAFNFCRTPANIAEYHNFLVNPGMLPIPGAQMKEEALIFCYMHNLYEGEGKRQLFSEFKRLCNISDGKGSFEEFSKQLSLIENHAEFPKLVQHVFDLS